MLAETWNEGLAGANHDPNWIWQGLLAPKQIALLTGLWKTGKTTLLSLLLSRRGGGGKLLDRTVRPGTTAVFTEESREQWQARAKHLGFGPVCFFFRPFVARPTSAQFEDMIAQLRQMRCQRGLDLVVFDPLTMFLPLRTENSTEEILAATAPLRRLADDGLSLLLQHHPAKGNPALGQAARGAGALSGIADILLELRPADPANPSDRRRLFFGFSRSPETPRALCIKLNGDGTDYAVLPDALAGDFPRHWPVLFGVLEDAQDKLTRLQILEHWPADFPRPSLATLWRWLDDACERNLICREGAGRAADPFHYWIAGREQEWLKNPVYRLLHRLPPLEIP
jgi:hypothetical protein